MAMTVTSVLSFVLGLLALSAFFVAAIVMTIFLMRETELPEMDQGLSKAQGAATETEGA
jgi:hypothetical protein